MTGLIGGSLSTLAPVFAVAFATRLPLYAFFAALATAIGAGVSMAFSEVALAWVRWRFFGTGFVRSFVAIALGGVIITAVSVLLGTLS